MHFKMLSAICFNLEQSKILFSGNGLMPFSALSQPQVHMPMFLFRSVQHNILTKPLAAFPENHCLYDGQW